MDTSDPVPDPVGNHLTLTAPPVPVDTGPTSPLPVTDGLIHHYDPDTLDGSYADGDIVEAWDDSGGRGLTLQRQKSGGPTYQSSGVNGNPALQFGGGHQLAADTTQQEHPFVVFAVASVSADSSSDASEHEWIFDGWNGGDSPTSPVSVYWHSGEQSMHMAGDLNQDTGYVPTAGEPYLYTAIFNGGSSELRVDGSTVWTGSLGSINPSYLDGISIGERAEQYNQGVTGYVGDVAYYDRVLSSSEISDVESALADSNGISGVN